MVAIFLLFFLSLTHDGAVSCFYCRVSFRDSLVKRAHFRREREALVEIGIRCCSVKHLCCSNGKIEGSRTRRGTTFARPPKENSIGAALSRAFAGKDIVALTEIGPLRMERWTNSLVRKMPTRAVAEEPRHTMGKGGFKPFFVGCAQSWKPYKTPAKHFQHRLRGRLHVW